jgi:AraC-like DNA-binding protein/mannose-6-phosphate isomerase-like protein (cupin superfamily)
MKPGGKKTHSLQQLHPLESLGNTPARTGDIRVERLEQRLQPKVPFPHRHDFFHFLFLEKGSGWHEIDFQRFKVRAGQLFLVQPGQVHSWSLGSATKGYVLEFTRASLGRNRKTDEIWKSIESAPALISSVRSGEFAQILRLMLDEFRERGSDFRLSLEHLLTALLLKVSRESRPSPARTQGASLVREFQAMVEENFSRYQKVDEYARQLGITPKALTTKVSRVLGRSAGAVIQDRRLAEAKRMLAYSDLAVAEVGYGLGYDDPNYFARFFRKHTGMAPGKFRKLASRTVHG